MPEDAQSDSDVIKHSVNFNMSPADWQSMAEMEAVLNVTRKCSTLAQVEKGYMAAYTHLIKQDLLNTLRSGQLRVVKLEKVSADPKLEREVVEDTSMSDVGRECVRRAILEAERRWGENTTEHLEGSEIALGHRESICMPPLSMRGVHLWHRVSIHNGLGTQLT